MGFSKRQQSLLAEKAYADGYTDPVEAPPLDEGLSYAELKVQADLAGVPTEGRSRSRAGLRAQIEEHERVG